MLFKIKYLLQNSNYKKHGNNSNWDYVTTENFLKNLLIFIKNESENLPKK